jgi:hypothetical protein
MRWLQAALSPGSLPDEAKRKCETAIEKVEPNFTCFPLALLVRKQNKMLTKWLLRSWRCAQIRYARSSCPGTQFTCFTGTKVQILTLRNL